MGKASDGTGKAGATSKKKTRAAAKLVSFEHFAPAARVVALVVSFGLGLSATIHFLNRLRLESKPGEDPSIGVEQATILVGPALILTSVVLSCGLAVMVFSDLPSLRLFGWLSAFSMMAALVADLLILRPTAMYVNQIARRLSKSAG